MNIQHTDTDKNQETPARNSASRHTENTVQSEKASPIESFPQPPRRPTPTRRDRWYVIAAVIIALVLILSVGAIVISQHPAAQITPTPTVPATTLTPTPGGGDTTPTPVPGIVWGPQPGPAAVSDTTYWDRIPGIQGTNAKVEHVYFANVMGNPSLQVLVTVRHSDVNSTLDVYVFDKITSTNPTQLFKLQGLVKGDAKISGYNTILTAEVDQNSTLNTGKSSAQWMQDIFREFEWNGSKGTLVQVVFPGMFPDLTRWQAEVAQNNIALQQDTWKLDAMKTAQKFVEQFMPTAPSNPPAKLQLVGGGGAHDLTAQINAAFPYGTNPGPTTRITLKRLEGNVNGIWEVTAVQADWMYISSPQSGTSTHISNPVTVSGYGPQFESQVGTVYILDHLYTAIGKAYGMGYAGFGDGPFTVKVPYQASFQAGAQEGIVELVHTGGASFDYGVVMIKVLVNP